LITEGTDERLQLSKCHVSQAISGISDTSRQINCNVHTTLKSRASDFEWSSNFAVIASICAQQPSSGLDATEWNMPEGIVLADPTFYQSSKIDILIGIEGFFEALRVEKCRMGTNTPTPVNTRFHWVIGGSTMLPTEPER